MERGKGGIEREEKENKKRREGEKSGRSKGKIKMCKGGYKEGNK